MGSFIDELAKDGAKAIFTSGGGGTMSAAVGAVAFNYYAESDCDTSLLSTSGLCLTKHWQVLGITFHSAGAAAAFFGPALGMAFVLIWIFKVIHDIIESNARGKNA
jgi:hypothetical protein